MADEKKDGEPGESIGLLEKKVSALLLRFSQVM